MKINAKLREKFAKDMKLPIKIFDNDDIFNSRVELFDNFYDSKESYARFLKTLEKYNSFEEYNMDYHRVVDTIINKLRTNKAFENFNSLDFAEQITFVCNNSSYFPKKNIYSIGKFSGWHLSIDIKKANFSCLKYYNPAIFDYCETWEDYISSVTDNEHIINCKSIRETIFGVCNSNHQLQYEKYLMLKFYMDFAKRFPQFNEDIIEFFSNDEIIFHIDEKLLKQNLLHDIALFVFAYKIPLRMELFTLTRVFRVDNNDNLAFVKNVYDLRQDDVKSVIKGAEATFVPMIVRHLQDQPYTPEDLYFIYQGLLCSYINPPKLNHETIVP